MDSWLCWLLVGCHSTAVPTVVKVPPLPFILSLLLIIVDNLELNLWFWHVWLLLIQKHLERITTVHSSSIYAHVKLTILLLSFHGGVYVTHCAMGTLYVTPADTFAHAWIRWVVLCKYFWPLRCLNILLLCWSCCSFFLGFLLLLLLSNQLKLSDLFLFLFFLFTYRILCLFFFFHL